MAKRIKGLDPDMPAGEAAALILETKAAKMFELEDAAASGTDMDAVHDMRVASRRLRASMQIFEPLYRRKSFRRWYDMGRGVTKSLGKVRDADVFIDAFGRLTRKRGLNDGQRIAIAYIVGHRQGERMADVERLNRRLGKMDLAGSRKGFSKFLHDHRKSPMVDAPLSELARDTVPVRLESVLGYLPAALIPENAEAQHAMRIEFKRLRYAIETLSPCFDERLDEILAVLKDFQDALGEVHDHDVFIDIVRDIEDSSDARAAGVKDAYLEEVLELLEAERKKRFGRFRSLMRRNGQRKLRSLILGSFAAGCGSVEEPAHEAVGETGSAADAGSEPDRAPEPPPERAALVAASAPPGEEPESDVSPQPEAEPVPEVEPASKVELATEARPAPDVEPESDAEAEAPQTAPHGQEPPATALEDTDGLGEEPPPDREPPAQTEATPPSAEDTDRSHLPERRRSRARERADMPIPEESHSPADPPLVESP
jgi:CHAD domain-containing protein